MISVFIFIHFVFISNELPSFYRLSIVIVTGENKLFRVAWRYTLPKQQMKNKSVLLEYAIL